MGGRVSSMLQRTSTAGRHAERERRRKMSCLSPSRAIAGQAKDLGSFISAIRCERRNSVALLSPHWSSARCFVIFWDLASCLTNESTSVVSLPKDIEREGVLGESHPRTETNDGRCRMVLGNCVLLGVWGSREEAGAMNGSSPSSVEPVPALISVTASRTPLLAATTPRRLDLISASDAYRRRPVCLSVPAPFLSSSSARAGRKDPLTTMAGISVRLALWRRTRWPKRRSDGDPGDGR
jgi:hypothetical protein